MPILLANPEDLDSCLELNTSFETQRVWQLSLRDSRGHVAAELRPTDLPRSLQVGYPSPGEALLMHWQRGYCILVAKDPETGAILGYADVGPEPDLQVGWIYYLAVDAGHRREGVGSALLLAAMHWCRDNRLVRAMAPLQGQNDPGVRFLQRHGFTFCGFNDRYFSGGNVALFLGRSLR